MDASILFNKLGSINEVELIDFIKQSENFSAKQIQEYLDYIYQQSPSLDLGLELYDCCGTGGDGANTFNISTATAIVAAAAGIKVCKNGGRSSSSTTGSVDVLEALGLNLGASLETKIEGLKKTNLAFYSSPISAELLAPIKQLCRKHKLTSLLSLIGPLASPVQLAGQIVGVGREKWFDIMVDLEMSLIKQGLRQRAIVLISEFSDGSKVDELTSASKSKIIVLDTKGKTEFDFNPQDIGLNDPKEDLAGSKDHQENASILASILETGSKLEVRSSKLNTVALNVALLNYLANKNQTQNYDEFLELLGQYIYQAIEIIVSGKAQTNFSKLKEVYQS